MRNYLKSKGVCTVFVDLNYVYRSRFDKNSLGVCGESVGAVRSSNTSIWSPACVRTNRGIRKSAVGLICPYSC